MGQNKALKIFHLFRNYLKCSIFYNINTCIQKWSKFIYFDSYSKYSCTIRTKSLYLVSGKEHVMHLSLNYVRKNVEQKYEKKIAKNFSESVAEQQNKTFK